MSFNCVFYFCYPFVIWYTQHSWPFIRRFRIINCFFLSADNKSKQTLMERMIHNWRAKDWRGSSWIQDYHLLRLRSLTLSWLNFGIFYFYSIWNWTKHLLQAGRVRYFISRRLKLTTKYLSWRIKLITTITQYKIHEKSSEVEWDYSSSKLPFSYPLLTFHWF